MAVIQFSGLASGIDSSALIDALLTRERETRVEPLENKISSLEDSNTALGELSSLLERLRESSDIFRTLSGGGISKLSLSSDESIVTTTASNFANRGSYDLTVSQLATAGTLSFDDRYTSANSAIYGGMNDLAPAADRTVTVDIGTGGNQESVSIELTSTTTLSDFAASFNAQSESATASVANVGTSSSPSYALIIKAEDTGVDEGSISVSVGAAVTDSGAGAFSTSTIQQAQDAEFSLGGVAGTITRSDNTVSDLIDGVTLNLQSTGTASVTVGLDVDTTSSQLKEFVEAYNELVSFIGENDAVTSQNGPNGVENIFGALASTQVDDNVLSSIRGAFASASLPGGQVSILADLGITTKRDGTLDFDEDTFKDVLVDDPESTRKLLQNLADNLSNTGGVIDQYTRFNGLIDTTVNSQAKLITQYNDEIGQTENRLRSKEEQLNLRFAKLEGIIGKLQSQQSSLSSILSSL